jgi:hypothetical protein
VFRGKPGFNIISYKPVQLTNTIIGAPKPHSGNADEYKGIENCPTIMNDGRQSPSRKRGLGDQNIPTPNKRPATAATGNVLSNGILDIAMITPYVNK